MLVSIVTLLRFNWQSAVLVFVTSLSGPQSLMSFCRSFENLTRVYGTVTCDCSNHLFWICAFFCDPDGDVSSRRWPRDVWSPSAPQHSEEEEVGRSEAAVEASGLVWDRSAARVLQPDLHDEGGTGSCHSKHYWHRTYSEYGSAEATIQSLVHMHIHDIWTVLAWYSDGSIQVYKLAGVAASFIENTAELNTLIYWL